MSEFHPEAHDEATTITGSRSYGKWGQCIAPARSADRRCRQPAKGPHGKCRNHGGNSPGAPIGEANGNYKHGAFSQKFLATLSDDEVSALEDLTDTLREDPEKAKDVVAEIASELVMKYRRSNDVAYIREMRQLLSEFNIVDATDHVEVEGNVTTTVEHTLSEKQQAHLDQISGGDGYDVERGESDLDSIHRSSEEVS